MKNELSLQVKDDIESVCDLHEEDNILTPKSWSNRNLKMLKESAKKWLEVTLDRE